jgi:2-iminobutanoate/2-iminopropanoate deaminase
MSAAQSFHAGIALQLGHHADAVRIPAGYDQIVVSGTPGLAPNGALASDIGGQAMQAWRNVEAILLRAGVTLADVVSVREWLVNQDDVEPYLEVRTQFISERPASMLAVVPGLVRPDFLVTIEVLAAVRGAGAIL